MKRSPSRSVTGPWLLGSAGLAVAALLAGCTQGSSSKLQTANAGTVSIDPNNTDGFEYFVVDAHRGGKASEVKIVAVAWGRLVDVFATDATTGQRQKLFRDLLIDPFVESDGLNFRLEHNPVTLREELTILHAFGTPGFDLTFEPFKDDLGLQPLISKGVGPGVLPPFTAVARNAAVVVVTDDLLDASSISHDNIKLAVGYPPVAPYEVRVVPDRCHGDLSSGQLRSTRVLLDMTVSESEAQAQGISVNTLGLPSAQNTTQANIAVRIPTVANTSAAQFGILKNLGGSGLSFTGNGPADAGSPTLDVVRGFRSGGRTVVTQDAYDGFLPDKIPPQVIGSQAVTVSGVQGPLQGDLFQLDLAFSTLACAQTPRAGDLLVVGNGVMLVVQDANPISGGVATDVLVVRVDDQTASNVPPTAGSAEFKTPWDPNLGQLPACFVTFSPQAGVPPATGLSTGASVTVSFSEPMNPERVEGFEGLQLTDPSVPANLPLQRTVVGEVVANPELTSHTFFPSLPLNHVNGQTETFHLDIVSFFDAGLNRVFGVTDLAGNPVEELLPQVSFTVDSAAPSLTTGGTSLRFTQSDENGDGNPEIRGQVVPDFSRGIVQPRAMVRFNAFADTTNQSSAVVQAITPVGGVVEPLSIYGSRTMSLWRYHDLRLPFFDDQYFNIDVEGLAWMVASTGVQIDLFPEFQLGVAHSRFLPDELIGMGPMGTVFLAWPNSGVVTTFESNLLDPVNDPLTIMAPKGGGYPIQSLDSFQVSSGTWMHPYPVNINRPVSQYDFWTWRDTAILSVGGPNGQGVDTGVNPPIAQDGFYPAGAVPTIGLPLLMDWRTYPAPTAAQGSNLLFLGAVNSAGPNAGLPFFRLHSTGGVLPNGQPKLIEPDLELSAQGGIDPTGAPTPPIDSGFYYGSADFVARVNRMHTIWFDTGSPSSFGQLVIDTGSAGIPAGTQMSFDFRGATSITVLGPAQDGANIDPYGDPMPMGTSFGVTFLNGDRSWKSTLSDLDGARYIQVRVTMVTNAETGAWPELSAFGVPFYK